MIVLILEHQKSGQDGFTEPKQFLLHYFDINVKVNITTLTGKNQSEPV